MVDAEDSATLRKSAVPGITVTLGEVASELIGSAVATFSDESEVMAQCVVIGCEGARMHA